VVNQVRRIQKPLGIYTPAMKGVHNMKVAVSSTGNNLDAQLDPRFGRCQFFLIVNPDDMSFEALNNESAAQGGGAGIQAAQFLASQGVAVGITGNCGPNAVQPLSAAGIELFANRWERSEMSLNTLRMAISSQPVKPLPTAISE